ncbi:MAG TPA: hypothetical protein VHI98_28920 [Vicinamibacterales bacterium]|nr:hypothetical protein [Vicinamibacterales bacterium]
MVTFALVVLPLSLSLQTGSPEALPPIRELVKVHGISEQVLVGEDAQLTPAELLSETTLVIRGVVRSRNDRLSNDGRTVLTDYAIEVVDPIHPQNGWLRVQDVITVRRPEGAVNVSGRTFVSRENDFPGFGFSEEYFLFLRQGDTGVHYIVGGRQGAYRVSHGSVPMFTGRPRDPEVPVTEFTRGVRAEIERQAQPPIQPVPVPVGGETARVRVPDGR